MNKYKKAINKLKECVEYAYQGTYDDELKVLQELVEKETQKSPSWDSVGYADGYPVLEYSCPNCNYGLDGNENRCQNCGQLLDWSENCE